MSDSRPKKSKTNHQVVKLLAEYPEYIPVLEQWLYRGENWTQGDQRPSGYHYLQKRLNHKCPPMAFIALDDGEPNGTCSIKMVDYMEGLRGAPILVDLYVPLEHRRKGVGSILCNAAKTKCSEVGFRQVFAYTLEQTEFFRSLRWNLIGYRRVQMTNVTVIANLFASSVCDI